MSLHKIRTRFIRQDDPNWTKKWFQDKDADLFIWLDSQGRLMRFQLTLGAEAGEIVEWIYPHILRTGRVHGRGGVVKHQAPTIEFDRTVSASLVSAALGYLNTGGNNLPPDAHELIRGLLETGLRESQAGPESVP